MQVSKSNSLVGDELNLILIYKIGYNLKFIILQQSLHFDVPS